ncbi:potassium/proton antiporter [Mangrovibrevibacter kandeliae]|uniref:potassium/proton antiporter n=1 Tax=Mangrovibrevibacter kandeliae TaxID=2968473 RepID=UPI00211979DD|nr:MULTISPECIES: potassium/proton antiporter [unclassified Aurantimonas]MCQ8784208.1 potassium/proton antiporter [Aurantimonas sp. CSK15Z-1]MCW4116950.1 potassium/proton antiporter [Aurantimonas sp. MSK8Z-1]
MLEPMYLAILVGTLLVLAAGFSSLLAFRFGAPLLLVFLSVGLVAGEDGLGLHFDNAPLAYFAGSLALAIILFDSGFSTSLSAFRLAAAPALTLATAGVLITAVLFGLAATWVLDIGRLQGLLLGAIVGSTDAAAVFFLLRIGGIHVRERVRATLEVESGSNDPMAIFLTIALVELIHDGHGMEAIGPGLLWMFVKQMGIGAVLGLAGGSVIRTLMNRLGLERGLAPIFALALSLLVFALAGALDGSGFLAVYVAGLTASNLGIHAAASLRRFQEGVSWLCQIVMFLVLGLFATPSQFPSIAGQALLLAAVLIFVARPIAVWLCLLPFGFRRREEAFIAWVGLRGSVSVLLAIVPLLVDLPSARLLFNTAFIIVLASLLVQGWTLGAVARRLRLVVPERKALVEKVELELPGTAHHELLSYHVVANSPVVRGERIPRWARPSLVIRDGRSMPYQYAGRLQEGDYVYIFISPRHPPLLDRLFASPAALGSDDADFFGDFGLDPQQPLAVLAEAYGISVPDREASRTVAEFMTDFLGGRAEYGDRVPFGPVELIVRDADEAGRVMAAGLKLEPDAPAPLPSVPVRLARALLRPFGRV